MCVFADVMTQMSRYEKVWDEFEWNTHRRAQENDPFYHHDASWHKIQLSAHLVLAVNSLLILIGIVYLFHVIL